MKNFVIFVVSTVLCLQLWALSFDCYTKWIMQKVNAEVQVGEIIIIPKNSE